MFYFSKNRSLENYRQILKGSKLYSEINKFWFNNYFLGNLFSTPDIPSVPVNPIPVLPIPVLLDLPNFEEGKKVYKYE